MKKNQKQAHDLSPIIGTWGTHTDGQRVQVKRVEGMFYVVKTETGNTFTVHMAEFTHDGLSPTEASALKKARASWPETDLHIAVIKTKGVSTQSLMVGQIKANEKSAKAAAGWV